ncbi:hypothetical protein TNCV_351741 [Trichonephila clavipes]|nr:hypothetical protein TNCV_351741 [Trichonephila clavipes]
MEQGVANHVQSMKIAIIIDVGRTMRQTMGVVKRMREFEASWPGQRNLHVYELFTTPGAVAMNYRSLRTRMCGSCTMVHQQIFRFQCVTSSMLHIQRGALHAQTCYLAFPASSPSIP